MNKINVKKDYEYFTELWEYRRPGGVKHSAELWNKRADDWASDLDNEDLRRKQMTERVSRTAEYLRSRGLLRADNRVVDIGCGPGRFIGEFAKTAGHVLGLDFSQRMLEHAAEYTRSLGQTNVSFQVCDFQQVDVEEQDWQP